MADVFQSDVGGLKVEDFLEDLADTDLKRNKLKVDRLIVVAQEQLVVLAGQFEARDALKNRFHTRKSILETSLLYLLLVTGHLLKCLVQVKHLRLLVILLG